MPPCRRTGVPATAIPPAPQATNVQLTPLRLLHYRPPARRPMPEPTPADALERMRRQVRAVRWRRNLHELQRALYHLIAGLGGAMTALVVLALRAGSGVFALATWTLAAATLLLAGGLARALARRWLSSEQAPLWIDRRTALEGRLATALELEGRDARCAPFFPLLVDDNARRIAAWRPERLVPEGLPSGAFAGALAAVGVFLLALLLAPWLPPSAPAVAAGGDAADRVVAVEADRVFAHGVRARAGRLPATLVEPDDDDRSALSRLPAELQELIRAELWGEDRERVHEAWERAERGAGPARVSPPADPLAEASDPIAASEQEERWAVVRRPPPGARPALGEDGATVPSPRWACRPPARRPCAPCSPTRAGRGRRDPRPRRGRDPRLPGDLHRRAARGRAGGGGPRARHRHHPDRVLRRRPRADRGRAGHRQDAHRALARRGARPDLQPRAVHRRPDAGRHHRHARDQRGRRRPPPVRLRPGAGLRPHPARRRDQPRHPEDAGGAPRGDGRPAGDGGRHELPARPALLRARDAEPDRDGGHLPAPGGAARSLPVQGAARLPIGARAGAHPGRDHGGRAARGAPRAAARDGGGARRGAEATRPPGAGGAAHGAPRGGARARHGAGRRRAARGHGALRDLRLEPPRRAGAHPGRQGDGAARRAAAHHLRGRRARGPPGAPPPAGHELPGRGGRRGRGPGGGGRARLRPPGARMRLRGGAGA